MDKIFKTVAARKKAVARLRKFMIDNLYRPAFNEFLKKQLKMKPIKNVKFKYIDIIDPKKEA